MNKRFCRIFLFSLLTAVMALISACGNEAIEIFAPKEVASAIKGDEGQVPVDVYMDATVSMRGYTTLAHGNLYRTLPDLLTDIGDSMGEVTFYKFGENVTKLDGREHRAFSSPEPYTELITAVHNAVDEADDDHLSIIVTDLFESDSDWSNVTKKLKDKYFSKHLAVAVIGVKNSFYGDIFDVGLNAAKYNYNSGDDPARFRPFYLLIMGNEKKVSEFMGLFREKVHGDNEMGFLLLSEYLTKESQSFSKMEITEGMSNLYNNSMLNLKDPTMREFGASDKSSPATLTVPFKYQPIFGVAPIDKNKISVKIRGYALKSKDDDDNDDNDSWENVESVDKIKTELVETGENEYSLKIEFTPEEVFQSGKINLINVRVLPDAKAYTLPKWVNEWNMPNVDIDPNNFDGAKTAHLNHVLESLKSSALSAASPNLLNINLVFDER